MEYLFFKEEMCNTMIKCYKKSILIQCGVIYFNIFVALLNGYIVYYQDPINLFTAICTGAIIINIFWLFANLHSMKNDLRMEVEYLLRIKEIKDCKEYKDSFKGNL